MKLLTMVLFVSLISFAQESECKLGKSNEIFRSEIAKIENIDAQLGLIKSKVIFDADFIEKDSLWSNIDLVNNVHISDSFGSPTICVFSKTIIVDADGNSCPDKIMFLLSTKRRYTG